MKIKNIILICIGILFVSVFIFTLTKETKENNNQIDLPLKGSVMIGDKSYTTLQEAIDHAKENDTIDIYSDIDENIVIKNHKFTINGNNFKINALSYIYNETSSVKSIIEIIDSNIIIKDLTLDGLTGIDENKPNIGIYINNSTVELNNITISNINHTINKLSNYPYGTCVYIVNSTSDGNKITLTGCNLINFHQTGIYINNHSDTLLDIEIIGNTIQGIGDTTQIEQRGIVVYGFVRGEINSNIIKDIKYLGTTLKNQDIIIIEDDVDILINNNSN